MKELFNTWKWYLDLDAQRGVQIYNSVNTCSKLYQNNDKYDT